MAKAKKRSRTYAKCFRCGKRIVKQFKNGERPNYCYGTRRYECLTCCEAHGWG